MSEFSLQVIGKKIIAKELNKEEEKKTSLLIVTQTKPTELVLEIMSVGEDIPIEPGQRILAKNGWMYRFKHDDEDLVLVNLDDVIGIVNEKA